ncbi:MAG: sugar phosphate isomerase/epimerase family protein [Planctomycetota bacterium]
MIKSISYWSFEHGLANTHPIDAALREAKEAGFEGLELCIGTEGVLSVESTRQECEAIRDQIDASGLVVQTVASGMSWGFNPVSNDPAIQEQAIVLHEAALQRVAWLGCNAMLFVPGVVTSPISPDERVRYDHALERAARNVRRLLETAERVGVDLCLENVWNGLFYSPVELASFIDDIDHERLGVYLDVGNLLGYQQHPPHWIELLEKRIKRVHVKDFAEEFGWTGQYEFAKLGEGQVPLAESVAELRNIGYAGTVVAEMMPWTPTLLVETSKAMDAMLSDD